MIVGFAGSGNMAAAMARGWADDERIGTMLFSDSGSGRADALAEELGGERCGDLAELAGRSEFVVLAVKPSVLATAGPPLSGKPVVSLLGGTPLSRLREAIPDTPVLRVMPNVAVELREGVICHAPIEAGEGRLGVALGLLEHLGTVIEVPEERLDAATAVMGCSGAYFARACEALIEAGVDAGLDRGSCERMVVETAAGTGAVLRIHDAASVQVAIASPGGSTEAGLEAFEEAGGPVAFEAAVLASLERMAGRR